MNALMQTYGRCDLAFERGEGVYLFTADGRRFLDFASGIAVNALGHSHPHLVEALIEQGRKLWHTSNLYRIPGQERLAERLAAATFADKVFFANSGVEAVECGVKLIRKYHDDFGDPNRYRVIAFEGSFHGRTLTALAAAGNEKYSKGYAPAVEGFDHCAFGNLNEVRAKIGPETAAILVEPVQGEGGMRAAEIEFLQGLRKVCDEFGLLLMFDEVQCGVGRTGRFFAHEWAGIAPDILATAKGIGGGFPLGVCLATDRVAAAFQPGAHGTTFGGNPLAMAIGNAVLDVILAPGFLDQVNAVAAHLDARIHELLRRFPATFVGLRGKGLMRGLKCADGITNTDLVTQLRGLGLLTVAAGDNVLRLLPPLIVTHAEVDSAIDMLAAAAAEAKAA
ncbi:acetylornithine/N-succinyldiaminopimelate aminotransferase [Dongia mobilis]|uniref:Acetylornithine aminotransferase n=1 Tax=Dongia mobilis TaxID=578943 RepID=A0A4R6WIN2_9PROT|nr:aspartate aminotransferase family protein [Dongia mobilis]TDQ78499.1 acetylornithine/N-succinyldiaminopimelate aminotransferase [Dongia mobilis]